MLTSEIDMEKYGPPTEKQLRRLGTSTFGFAGDPTANSTNDKMN